MAHSPTSPAQPGGRLRPFRPIPFGRYTLLLPLSTGGMGEVFLARLAGAQGFEKLCVIKRVLPRLAHDQSFIARFGDEAKTAATLSHGCIAQVLDMGIFRGEPFLALELVDGKDLRRVNERLRDQSNRAPLSFALYVMSRALDALAYAHRKRGVDEEELGLVHRDISPQNILVSYEGEVKVIDFGLAKSTLSMSETNPSVVLGKFRYMSPEQGRHERVDRRSDLYSLGLCLYELIAGAHPLDGVEVGELLARVVAPSFLPLRSVVSDCPASVEAMVAKALSIAPEERYASAEEFRGQVQACWCEVDPGGAATGHAGGPEAASSFMRELFSAEYHQERKLLAQLRTAPRAPDSEGRPEEETGVHTIEPGLGDAAATDETSGPWAMAPKGSHDAAFADTAVTFERLPEASAAHGLVLASPTPPSDDRNQHLQGEAPNEHRLNQGAEPVASPEAVAEPSALDVDVAGSGLLAGRLMRRRVVYTVAIIAAMALLSLWLYGSVPSAP